MYPSFRLGIGTCDVTILKSEANRMNWWNAIITLFETGSGCRDKKCQRSKENITLRSDKKGAGYQRYQCLTTLVLLIFAFYPNVNEMVDNDQTYSK